MEDDNNGGGGGGEKLSIWIMVILFGIVFWLFVLSLLTGNN